MRLIQSIKADDSPGVGERSLVSLARALVKDVSAQSHHHMLEFRLG